MGKKIKFLKCICLIAAIYFFGILLSAAQRNGKDNPHNLAANPKICLHCHNKRAVPAEEEKLKRIEKTHKFNVEAENCDLCHIFDSSDQIKDPRFKKSISEICSIPCHGKAEGLNHPVEVIPDYEVPSFLPLDNGEITCGTCHNPHSSPIIKTKSLIGWKEEKSYFLRMDNSRGELCRVCHADYPVFN